MDDHSETLSKRAANWDLDNIKTLCRLISLSKPEDVAEVRGWLWNHFTDTGERTPDGQRSYLEVLPYSFDEVQKAFWRALAGDDLTAILKGHLLIESLMNDVLTKKMPNAGVLFDESFMFGRKIVVLRRLGAITKQDAQALQAVNEIRNKFGHDPHLLRFTPEHWSKLRESIRPEAAKAIEVVVKNNGLFFVSTQSPASYMRMGLGHVYGEIYERKVLEYIPPDT